MLALVPDNKSHHYVPQFYLRRFAHDVAEKRVRLFRITARKHIPDAGIRGQCARDYLYGKDGERERALAALEGAAAKVIATMLDTLTVPEPGTQEAATLLTFVLFQSERTLAAADRQERMATQFVREIVRAHPAFTEEQKQAASDVTVKLGNSVGLAMHAAAHALPTVFDLRVKLLVNQTPCDFVTSDAPVVKHNQWRERIRTIGAVGYACAGLQILLPLSPRHLLLLFDPDVYRVEPSLNDVIDVTAEADVLALNGLQMVVANECVYYRDLASIAQVDALPTDAREEHRRVYSDQFVATDGPSTLIQVSHLPLPLRFRTTVIQLRPEAAAAPLNDRAQAYRPEALAIARALDVEREAAKGTPRRPPPGGRTFVRRPRR